MALFENAVEGLFEKGAATGVALGVGALLLAPALVPAIGYLLRPLAVGALRTGMNVYNAAASTTQDLVAEARAETEAEREPGRRRARTAEGRAS